MNVEHEEESSRNGNQISKYRIRNRLKSETLVGPDDIAVAVWRCRGEHEEDLLPDCLTQFWRVRMPEQG